jgi:hypothetical protein
VPLPAATREVAPARGVQADERAATTPPAPVTADRLKIRKVGTVCGSGSCPDLAIAPTSLKVQAYLTGQRPAGVWRIQRHGPGTAPFTTIASKALTAGGGYQSLMTTATGLEPGTTHRFRACFTPAGGVEVCGSEIQLTTTSA